MYYADQKPRYPIQDKQMKAEAKQGRMSIKEYLKARNVPKEALPKVVVLRVRKLVSTLVIMSLSLLAINYV